MTSTEGERGDADKPLGETLAIVIQEGEMLASVKALVSPGGFGRWVDEHFPGDRRYAYGAMRLAAYAQDVGGEAAKNRLREGLWADLRALVLEHDIEFAASPARGDDLGRLLAEAVQELPPVDLTDAGAEWWTMTTGGEHGKA
jgi:hypothetical protein